MESQLYQCLQAFYLFDSVERKVQEDQLAEMTDVLNVPNTIVV
jgi:hypothetical protein